MKRSHDEIGKRSLGALEFASAVNSDEPRAVVSALRRFSKTIRHQQRLVFVGNNNDSHHDDESSSDDSIQEEEMDEIPLKKKKRTRKQQETWMEDTESFNVPFVGTSVTRGDTGTLVSNQWPTGLCQAYLKASPMAVELTSADLIPPSGHVHKRLLSNNKSNNKNGKKASQAIYRASLEALAQLLTAYIPISTLQRDFGIETHHQVQENTSSTMASKDSIVSVIIRQRLAGLMALISDETGGGKTMDRPLVASALQVLANLSATSLGAAREVTRALDASLKDGILKSLLRLSKSESDDKNTNVGGKVDCVRMECLRLAAVLAEWQDAAIMSFITTKGSRERKINAGILHLAVRLGLNHPVFTNGSSEDQRDDNEYLKIVTRLLRAIELLFPHADSSSLRRPLVSTRDFLELVSGEALVHISQIATCAPPLTDFESFQRILDGNGMDMPQAEATPLEAAGIVGRRILFTFLANPSQSPFLLRMKHGDAADKQTLHNAQQLVRAMMLLLQRCASLPMQRFLIHCLQTTPQLVSHFFKMITVPDPKQTFDFMARMGFLFRLVRQVPHVSACVMESGGQLDEYHANQMVSCIIPENLKKHILSKALQSSNALIVSETLKLIYTLLDRYRTFLDNKGKVLPETFQHLLEDSFVRRLPDMQSLLSVRSRFDLFAERDDSKASAVVIGNVCKVLDAYALWLPNVLNNVKFDWVKLLPTEVDTFCSLGSVVQFQLLHTLENVLSLHEERADKHRLSMAAIRSVLGIVMTVTQSQVYEKARSLALHLICSLHPKWADVETEECIAYESSLWVDGLNDECIEEFCALLSSPANNAFQHELNVFQAWKASGFGTTLPSICFSSLLTTSLTTIATASEPFTLLTCQVLTKCLLYQRHPLPLASVISSSLADIDIDMRPLALLRQYAQSLLAAGDWNAEKRVSLLASLMEALFSSDSLQNMSIVSLQNGIDLDMSRAHFSIGDVTAAVRQCLHVLTLADDIASSLSRRCLSQLRAFVPLISQSDGNGTKGCHFGAILEHPLLTSGQLPWTELAYLKTAVLSSPDDSTRLLSFCNTLADKTDVYPLKDVLLLSLFIPTLPSHVASQAMREILRRVRQASSEQNSIAYSSYASLAMYWIEKGDSIDTSFLPLGASIEVWRAIVENFEQADDSSLMLGRRLESLLSDTIAAKDSERASGLYSLLLKSPSTETIQLCIRSKALASRSQDKVASGVRYLSLLPSLIVSDPSVFGASFLQRLIHPSSGPLIEKGVFDEEIAVLWKCTDLLKTEDFEKVQDALIRRAMVALSLQPGSRTNGGRNVDDGLVFLLSMPGMLLATHIDAFVNLACEAMKSKSKHAAACDKWLRLSHALLVSENLEGVIRESLIHGPLPSTVLVRAFQAVHISLKTHFKSVSSEASSESGLFCMRALDRVLSLLKTSIQYDDSLLPEHEGSNAVTNAIKSSLKYGLTHALDTDSSISECCLCFIRTLLVHVSRQTPLLHVLKNQCVLLDPATVLTLITSHSHFREVIAGAAVEGDVSKGYQTVLELIRLMLVCVSMSKDTISFDNEVWTLLLSSYNAGTTEMDITLKRLLYVYSMTLADKGMDADLPSMETFRWKGVAQTSNVDLRSSGWDWLANGLDITRVRATLSQFPVHDRIKPDPIRSVEVWLVDSDSSDTVPAETILNRNHDDASSANSSSVSSSGDSVVSMDRTEDDVEEGVAATGKDRHVLGTDMWVGSGNDLRYSPAFLLPLILGSLESSLSRSDLRLSTVDCDPSMEYHRDEFVGEQEESSSVKEYVLFAQRLCEKGALSLALASLCSECSSLRKVAVATLGHFKKALDTQEARKLSTWRERPQLAMIVDSVQRGLAVRVAMRRDLHENQTSLVVPKLPALSAVFLARASLIIVKPGDPMFGPINRYFLRLDDGYGAFQDTNRLPAFISLFCSSADEAGQARRERLWALQLLKDSFVEGYCYRMVEACHAPELILSNFGSIRARQEDNQHDPERILMLETMTSLLRNGGRRAASHLIGRLGLLSWLRGQLVTGDLIHILPSLDSRRSFLQLVFMTVNMARMYVAEDSSDRLILLMESKAFANHIILLYDDSISHGLIPDKAQTDTASSDSLVTACSETLCALVGLVNDFGSREDLGAVQHCGISLAPATRLLRAAGQDLKPLVVSSLCMAPLCHDEGMSESAVVFSESVLSFLVTNKEDKETSTAVLQRVTLLMSLLKSPLESDNGIIKALLACRPLCIRIARDAWFECLEAVVAKTASQTPQPETLCIATAILNAAS